MDISSKGEEDEGVYQRVADDIDGQLHPVERTNIFQRWFFLWVTPLITLGSTKPLEMEDFPPLPRKFRMSNLYDQINQVWKREMQTSKSPTFGAALGKAYWVKFVQSALWNIPYALIIMVQPFLVAKILQYIQTGEVHIGLGIRSGIGVAVILGVVSIIAVVSLNYGFYHITLFAFKIRASTIAMVFKKSLNLSSSVRSKFTTGEITTMMSVDAERLWLATIFSNWLWMGPGQICGAIVLLYLRFGAASLAAGGTVVFLQIFQGYMGVFIGRTRHSLVQCTENRIKLTNEALQGIRVVKLYSWEEPVEEKIDKTRKEELVLVLRYHLLKMVLSILQFLTPVFAAFVLFVVIASTGKNGEEKITIFNVYAAYALLNITRLPLALMPMAYSAVMEARVSLQRLTTFLLSEEMNQNHLLMDSTKFESTQVGKEIEDVSINDETDSKSLQMTTLPPAPPSSLVFISNANFSWDNDPEQNNLMDINLDIKKGELIAIVGSVAAGKSSLISAILGQIHITSGHYDKNFESAAFVSQDHWIQNATITDNILFGDDFDEDVYINTLDASQLSRDLIQLPTADKTQIGERGINLSGGQKARVSIARAIYKAAFTRKNNIEGEHSIYIFDDPLASVDVHVGKELFRSSFLDMLQGETTIVVLSSNYQFLPYFDRIIAMESGRIAFDGNFATLASKFPQYTVEGVDTWNNATTLRSRLINSDSNKKSYFRENREEIERARIPEKSDELITKEDREIGAVSLATYIKYFSAAGGSNNNGRLLFAFILFTYTISQILRIICDVWVGMWAQDRARERPTESDSWYFNIYIIMVPVLTLLVILRSTLFVRSCVAACKNLHSTLLVVIFNAPINTYFDVTPLGRIINRFSKDLDQVDSLLPDFFNQNLQNLFHVLGIIAVCVASTPYFVIVLIPLAYAFLKIQIFFAKSSREIKRLDGVSRSPMYSLFGEVLLGLDTIRSYAKQSDFLSKHFNVSDTNGKVYYSFWMASRWLAIRVDILSNLIILFVAVIAVVMKDNDAPVDENILGLALVYAMQLTGLLQWTVRVVIETENNMTAVERLSALGEISSEASRKTDHDKKIENNWPTAGNIEIKNLMLRYRPELPLVLHGIDISIPAGSKVGVCGRTGSGKSTLMLALFRIVEPEAGSSIEIDGVNIGKLGLDKLRSGMTIIPQDPVMFCGSIRYNLDPFDQYTDEMLWESLERVQLKNEILSNFPDKLDHVLTERGDNISVGQRQLLCIARALLRRSKVILMDEATASVDTETDQKIQSILRAEFKDVTVLTIAHRLETIADNDHIVVLDKGVVKEFGHPMKLIDKGGIFSGLVNELGPERRQNFMKISKRTKSYENLSWFSS